MQQSSDDREHLVLKDALDSVESLCVEPSIGDLSVGKMSKKSPFLSAELEIQVQNAGQRIRRQAEQERLTDFSSCRRVPVPIMDFTLPELEWKKQAGSAISLFKSIGISDSKLITKRIRGQAGGERKLRWRPLSGSIGKVSMTERIGVDDGKLGIFHGVADEEACYKMSLERLFIRQTLRFLNDSLRESEESEELAPAPLSKPSYTPFVSPRLSPNCFKRIEKPLTLIPSSTKRPRFEAKTEGSFSLGLLDDGSNNGVDSFLTTYMKIQAPGKVFPTKSEHFSGRDNAAGMKTSPGTQNPSQPPWGNRTPRSHAQYFPFLSPELRPEEAGSS